MVIKGVGVIFRIIKLFLQSSYRHIVHNQKPHEGWRAVKTRKAAKRKETLCWRLWLFSAYTHTGGREFRRAHLVVCVCVFFLILYCRGHKDCNLWRVRSSLLFLGAAAHTNTHTRFAVFVCIQGVYKRMLSTIRVWTSYGWICVPHRSVSATDHDVPTGCSNAILWMIARRTHSYWGCFVYIKRPLMLCLYAANTNAFEQQCDTSIYIVQTTEHPGCPPSGKQLLQNIICPYTTVTFKPVGNIVWVVFVYLISNNKREPKENSMYRCIGVYIIDTY